MRGVAASTGTGKSWRARSACFCCSEVQAMYPRPPRISSVIEIDTVRRRAREATRTTRSLADLAVPFRSGLKSIDRLLHSRFPTAAKRLVKADNGQQPGKLGLPQRILRLE